MAEIYGTNGSEARKGTAGNDRIFGRDKDGAGPDIGDDRLFGRGGDDEVRGYGGNDRLAGDDGLDFLVGGDGNDTLEGGAGDDVLVDDDNNVIPGGGDLLLFDAVNSLLNFTGPFGDDALRGGDGNDTLLSHGGLDVLDGGAGNDFAIIGRRFGEADLTLDVSDTGKVATLRGDGAKVVDVEKFEIYGGGGDDTFLTSDGDDVLSGGEGDDVLNGRSGGDRLYGGEGDDRLFGGRDSDFLFSHEGSDRLDGGGDGDLLGGFAGDDRLTGGSGSDVFLYILSDDPGSDTITDFEDTSDAAARPDGLDRIELRINFDSGGDPLGMDDLIIRQQGGDTVIKFDLDRDGKEDRVDLDGDGRPDPFRITLLDTRAGDLGEADFIF